MNSVLVWYEQNGTQPDQHRVRDYIEDTLFRELNLTLSQSVSHWKQQAEFWVGWARSLGVETGKVLYFCHFTLAVSSVFIC